MGAGQESWEGDSRKVTDGHRKTCLEAVRESSAVNHIVYRTVASTSFELPTGQKKRRSRVGCGKYTQCGLSKCAVIDFNTFSINFQF